jgi:hypothetical protein
MSGNDHSTARLMSNAWHANPRLRLMKPDRDRRKKVRDPPLSAKDLKQFRV